MIVFFGTDYTRKGETASAAGTYYTPLPNTDVGATPKVGDHAVDNLCQADFGLVANQVVELAEVWHTPGHVFEPGLVRLVVRNRDDRGTAARQLLDLGGKGRNGHLFGIPNVEDLSDRSRFYHQLEQGPDDVGHVREAARLSAVAKHRDLFAGERLAHKRWHDHSVLTGLARAYGIEKANDDDRKFLLFPVGERQELIQRFAARIRPSVSSGRSHHQIRILAEGNRDALAVDL